MVRFALALAIVFVISGCATTQQQQRGFWELQDAWFTASPQVTPNFRSTSGAMVYLPGPYLKNLYDAKQKLLPFAGMDFDLVIVEGGEINAFAFDRNSRPKIGFTVGYIQRYGYSTDIIGITMGHEIAHHSLSHTDGRRLQREKSTEATAQVLGTIASQIIPFSGLAVGTGVRAIGRSYTRDEERAADGLGLELASKAGFNLCQGRIFWNEMSKSGGGTLTLQFLSTHPGADERVKTLEEFVVKQGRGPCQ